jgi:methyl-accepting chemotaxis protein
MNSPANSSRQSTTQTLMQCFRALFAMIFPPRQVHVASGCTSPNANNANKSSVAEKRITHHSTLEVASQAIASERTAIDRAAIELGAMQRVLSALSMQLNDIDTDIHGSVLAVTQGFHGMANRAKQAAQLASTALAGSEVGSGSSSPIEDIQRVLNLQQQEIEEASRATRESSQRLLRIEEHLEKITKEVASIEQLAQRARVVALNGQIEASRLGAAGNSFMVVVEETKELSIHATQTGRTIRDVVECLTREIVSTSETLREQSDIRHQRVELSHQNAHELLTRLEASHQQLSHSISQTQLMSRDLGADISKSVMAMQFEDRVSQRISHVTAAFQMLAERIRNSNCCEDNVAVDDQAEELLTQIASKFTMESEHDAIRGRKSSGGAAAEISATETSTVELF